MRKYEFTGETLELKDSNDTVITTLRRIKSLIAIPFRGVVVGDVGGFIEHESNLDHEGLAWVADNACVYGNAHVYEDAIVKNDAKVYDNAKVYGTASVLTNASVYNDAEIFDDASITNNAKLYGSAKMYDESWAGDFAKIYGFARVHGRTILTDNVRVFGNADTQGRAIIEGDARVYGHASLDNHANISGCARIFGYSKILDNASVFGDACVYGDAIVGGNAMIPDSNAVMWVSNVGPNEDTLTFFMCKDGTLKVQHDTKFCGSVKVFKKYIKTVYGNGIYAKIYKNCINMAYKRISIDPVNNMTRKLKK